MRAMLICLAVLMAPPTGCWSETMDMPIDFPTFSVPGFEQEMKSIRELYWLHYPGSGPKSTLWDAWLAPPSLWPAVSTGSSSDNMRAAWRSVLLGRIIDAEGYVSTHQHASIAHPLGWPFPAWNQGAGVGWHFSFKDTVGPPWRPNDLSTTAGWTVDGAQDNAIGEAGWKLTLTQPRAVLTAPKHPLDTLQSPFLQLRWMARGLGNAEPYVEWLSGGAWHRMFFDPVESDAVHYTVVPVYKHPDWSGQIEQLRIGFGNAAPGAEVIVHSFFTTYDTRHNINSQSFVHGSANYFRWTRDLNFLRDNINRMRTALRYVMIEHEALERGVVYSGWVGHDGRSGLVITETGEKQIRHGVGIGDNYWDLLPFGNLDFYASMLYYVALLDLAELEEQITQHPEWNMPLGVLRVEPEQLRTHAQQVKAQANSLFWNDSTGRFVPNIDVGGKTHDYGFTFLNLEAVYYDFATPEHAGEIVSWVSGERSVEGDTSTGSDIYFWRFAPRATTRRNVDYYFWAWSGPEAIPYGGQVQDGGAVLGWSYHDLMSRLKVLGPDNAWQRLREIGKWFDEVKAAGGYRKYYDGSRPGTLQGGGTAGGLGLDAEFFESVLVPQVMIEGFLGFKAYADGFGLDPRLPSDWPELTIDRIRWQDLTLRVRATRSLIELHKEGEADDVVWLRLPAGDWNTSYVSADGAVVPLSSPVRRDEDGAVSLTLADVAGLRLQRSD